MLLDCVYVNVEYYLICVKLFKMPLKFVTVNDNVFQLLRDFVPQIPYRGAAPGPRWGTSVPQTPSLVQF